MMVYFTHTYVITEPEWVNPMATFVFKDNLKLILDLHYAVALFDITISVTPWYDTFLTSNTMYIQTAYYNISTYDEISGV